MIAITRTIHSRINLEFGEFRANPHENSRKTMGLTHNVMNNSTQAALNQAKINALWAMASNHPEVCHSI